MSLSAALQRFRSQLTHFHSAEGGQVALTFGLVLLPIIGAVGAAVDYSRANSDKAAMQAAIDATALMLSKNAFSLTPAQIQTQATAYFNALYTRPEVTNVSITPTYTNIGGSQIVLTASGKVPTKFVGMMGFNNLDISASTTVKWGNVRLRVALVLDNTGSMGQSGKLTALKTATNNLLTQLQSAASQNGDVYISIVPFSKDVNVDPVNYAQTWIDWTEWDAANGTCSNNNYTKKSTCEGAGKVWTPKNHNTWNGCVEDRGNTNGPSSLNTDTNASAPVPGNLPTLYPAEQYSSCTQKVMPLSYNWAGMTNLVNNMTAAGNTNQGIGLQLGWMSLVGGGPFPAPPPTDPNFQYQKVIILLTDGLNTQNRWYGSGNVSQINARQQMTCNNINAAGITLYAVQVNTGGDPTSSLLQNCAGSPGKYPDSSKFFLLTSANQIIATFQQIGTTLSNLRVAK